VIGEAISGLRHLTGDPDWPPARVGLPLTDYIAGLYAALGTLVAVIHREHTGEGQCVDAALYEASFSFLRSEVPNYHIFGEIANRAGSRLPTHVPSNLYETRDGRYLHISAGNNSLFRRLTNVMGRAELADDPRFADPVDRAKNEDQIDPLIAKWVKSFDLDRVEKVLQEADVVASRIFTVEDIFKDPHFAARCMLPAVPDDELGSLVLPGVVPKLSKTPGALRHTGGQNGRDTEEVLREYTSLSDADLFRLEEKGIIRQAGKNSTPDSAAFRPATGAAG
jgi:crotonobetainyl-CoA:carnitine CoA-transferase CaiB-like acyl-CoA transferase